MERSSWRGKLRRPPVSAKPLLRTVATRFAPSYEIRDSVRGEGIRLVDPSGTRPDITLRHRYERRLFLRANYLVASTTISGEGPASDAELVVSFRGSLSRQRGRVAWKGEVPGGEEWLARLQEGILEAIGGLQAVQSLRARWSSKRATWHLMLETMSGSMVSGILAVMPISIPFDREEAESFVRLIDVLAGTRTQH